ncbi:hypothetical protein IFM89_000246 [Coptis chinensis]|uniref:Uncharacterized protein n=1 Tax=Coptis chinensis TaxID=261450 RepID=A0A835M3U8_9MAGN|nr:hypothetical protein IFM89_000246 [Coptis chinensis]
MMVGITMLRSHPDAKRFRYKPLTNYDELAIIVGKNNAKGVGANTGGELDKAREEVKNNGSIENDGHEDINGKNEGSDKQLKRETNSVHVFPIVDVNKLCQEVNKVPDFDRSLTPRVVDLLAADKTKEHVFYGLPDDFKKEWLMMHLNV